MKKILASLALAALSLGSFAGADIHRGNKPLTVAQATKKVDAFYKTSGNTVDIKVRNYVRKDGTSLYKGTIGGGMAHFVRLVSGYINMTTGKIKENPIRIRNG